MYEILDNERIQGKVKWWDDSKGIGFIKVEGWDKDTFAHFTKINSNGYKTLYDGETVEFNVSEEYRGLQAYNITRLGFTE